MLKAYIFALTTFRAFMSAGKTVSKQLMMLIPECNSQKRIDQFKGDYRARKFSCCKRFFIMNFAQLTGLESLRDIKNYLTAFSGKLYHSVIRQPISKSTLADVNERRYWHIYADFPQVLIWKAGLCTLMIKSSNLT